MENNITYLQANKVLKRNEKYHNGTLPSIITNKNKPEFVLDGCRSENKLPSYNGFKDKNLVSYFANERVLKHLEKTYLAATKAKTQEVVSHVDKRQIEELSKRAEKVRTIYERTKTQLKRKRINFPNINSKSGKITERTDYKDIDVPISKKDLSGIIEKYKQKLAEK